MTHKHTPTPMTPMVSAAIEKGAVAKGFEEYWKDSAKKADHALKCHAALVEALEGFISDVQGMNGMSQRVAQAKAAIALAKGEQK